MNAANAFGAKYYTFHGTARYKKNSRSGLNDNFPKIGAALEQTRQFCEKYGVALSLETVEWSTYNRPGVFKELLKYCPRLSPRSISNRRVFRLPESEYLKETAGHISHVHVSVSIPAAKPACRAGERTISEICSAALPIRALTAR